MPFLLSDFPVTPTSADQHLSGEAHIHESCLNSFKRHRGNVCPKCETSYDQVPPSPLGEKATSRETDHFRTGPSRRKGGRRSGANEEEEEEDDDDDEVDDELEEEEGEGMSQSQVETQTQGDGDEIDQSQGRRNGPRVSFTPSPISPRARGLLKATFSRHGGRSHAQAVGERSSQKRNTTSSTRAAADGPITPVTITSRTFDTMHFVTFVKCT